MRLAHSLLPAVAFIVYLSGAPSPDGVHAASGKPLSRAELKACIQREEEMGRHQDALRKAQAAHEASGAKLSAEALELARILRTTDPGDAVAIELYNQRNDARNAEVDVHNKRAESLNATVAELQESEADYMVACASRLFLKADETAVLKELGLKERRFDRERRQAPARPAGRFSA